MSYTVKQDLLAQGGVTVGCKISEGVLRPTLAPKQLSPSVVFGFEFVAYAAGTKSFFACDGSSAYLSPNGYIFYRAASLAGNSPFLVEDIYEGKARALLINGANAMSYSGNNCTYFTYGANLSCGVMHCGRLFGADAEDKLRLRWSGEGGITDWKEGVYGGGSLSLDPDRGEILDILIFNGRLVAVRKYGFTVLNMFGSTENFSVSVTDTDTAQIIAGTAKVVGGVLIFCTSEGLCSFDGTQVKLIGCGISPDGRAEAYGGKYFVNCGGRLFCYDVCDGQSFLVDVDAEALCAADGMFVYNQEGAFRLGEGEYTYECVFGFGTGGRKTVTKIYLDGVADLEISNGRVSRSYKGACGAVRPNMRGESFTVKLTSSAEINSLEAFAEVCDAI